MTDEIIGRDAELSVVQAFLERPAERIKALVLEGDAGIGKSTLWLAGVAAARERSFQVLVSRPAEAERTLPNIVLGDLFADVEPEVLAPLPAPRRRAFDSALLRAESALPVDPRALGAAILTLLPLLARGRPLVLAIDDDQLMDASSAATLGFALRRLQGQPFLLLLSRRLVTPMASGLEEVVHPAEVERLRIGPMSVGAIQLLLKQRLGITLPRPRLLQFHEASGGNPFFALELARARSADPARDATVPLAVPASMERLVGARLEALDAPTRLTLLLIATHGRFPVGLLRGAGIPPEALDPARAANVIETADGVVRFTHPVLASAIHQGATGEERRTAHRRLATVVDDPVQQGRHLAMASDEPSNELAAVLESSANAAIYRGLPIAAAELAGHAVRLTPADAVDDLQRRAIAAARAHLQAGDGRRARAIATDVLARAPRGARRAEALILGSEMEDPGAALLLLEEALAEAAGAPPLEAAIHAELGETGRATNGRAWAARHTRDALRLAQGLEDDALAARALTMLAQDRFDRGDPQGFELVERAYHRAISPTEPNRVRWPGSSMAFTLTMSGDYGRARDWLERQLDEWRDRDEQVRSNLLWCLALVEMWSGRWSIASEYADQVREISVQYGDDPTDHLSPALVALHRGQITVARDHSQRALSLSNGHLLPQHVAVLGVCDLWSGSPTAALVHFVEAEHIADIRGWGQPNMRWWRAEYAEALLQLGRVDDAARLVDNWQTAAERLGCERVLAQVVRCRGLVAAARGDLPTALELLDEAADRHEAVGDPFGHGRALLALGVIRLRARQKRRARGALEAALAGFEALGAAGWAAAARSDLGRIGGRERIEGLSPSELRVASLVVEGRTNREIASALFLGERTVASHLTHVYAKLGIRSRTELTRRLLSHAAPSAGDSSMFPTS